MATISIDLSELEDFVTDLGTTKARLENLQPVMEEISEDLRLMVDDSFEKSRSPDNKRWAPHSPVTLRMRGSRNRGAAKLLVDRGLLRGSIIAQSGKDFASVGITGPASIYAGVQQFGNPNNKLPDNKTLAPIPARPFLPVAANGEAYLPEELEAHLATLILEYLAEPLEEG